MLKMNILTHAIPGKSNMGSLGLSSAALIRGNERTVLFDTGSHAVHQAIRDSLKKLDVALEDIDTVFCSHLHYDHINNLQMFPEAEVCVGRIEWENANREKDEWTPLESLRYIEQYRRIRLVEDGEEIMPGVRAILTSGHTAGHMSLLIEDEHNKIILAGDAVKNRSELEKEASVQYVLQEESVRSIQRLKKMAKVILPGHDCLLTINDEGHAVPSDDLTYSIELPEGFKDRMFSFNIRKDSFRH